MFTGAYAINPATGEKIPVFVADYVLMGYGTGAIMAVPGQDQRDWDFARKYDLRIIRTVRPPDDFAGEAYIGEGAAINSGFLDGLNVEDAKARIIEWLEAQGKGRAAVAYRLRDWLISRQRYWGTPIPIIYCDNCGTVPVPRRTCPSCSPRTRSSCRLASRRSSAIRTSTTRCVLAVAARPRGRRTQWIPSWTPRGTGTGTSRRTTARDRGSRRRAGVAAGRHLHRRHRARHPAPALRPFLDQDDDLGLVEFGEPFNRLYNQGIILGEDAEKMSKSRGNVVNPQDYVDRWRRTPCATS